MTAHSIFAETLYDGTGTPPRHNCLINYAEGRIRNIEANTLRAPRSAKRVEIATPGFIDLQINGAADTQFNDDPSPEALERIVTGAQQGGATHILPTFITAPGEKWHAALQAVRAALEKRIPGILGLHLEGPFLSPQKPGIHPIHGIRPITKTDISILVKAKMPLLVTLAPEKQPLGTVERLTGAGVIVFAGHSAATAAEIDAAIAEGLCGVTHLWNAMPAPEGRAPGIVVRTLTHPTLYASIIADGHHVDPLNLALAAKMMSNRLFLVTDSMQTFAGHLRKFDIMGMPVQLEAGRLTGPDGTLAGAHLGMDAAVRTMVQTAGLRIETAIAMATDIPARVMRLDAELGRIKLGQRASFTFLDANLHASGVCIDGQMRD